MSTNTSSLHIFELLRIASSATEPVGVTELSRQTGLPSTTVYRALITLEHAGYLERDPASAGFRLGRTPPFLALTLFSQFPVLAASLSVLDRLARQTGETVSLAVKIGWYGVRIGSSAGLKDIAYKAQVGATTLLHRRRELWTILMCLPDEEIDAYRRFVRLNYRAFTAEIDRSAFMRELHHARTAGFVTPPALLGNGYQFAAPVRDSTGRALACLLIAGPVLKSETPSAAAIRPWLRARDEVEATLVDRFKDSADPFAHLPANSIRLRAAG